MSLRDQFLLDPDVIFLNHGSFGACPIPVFETYQRWQLELERQPVAFLARRVEGLLDQAREVLAAYVNVDVEDLVFVPNATSGVNVVARSLPLQPGDEILTSDHEYGACIATWEYVAARCGARIVQRPLPLPLPFASPDAFVEHFWAGVTERTRVIYLSHITAPTALILPIAPIIARARAAGILTVIDGAHAPGQVPVDLKALDPDFYTGNCHKWLCAPKGAGFLYVRREQQGQIVPQVISWGWAANGTFAQRNQQQATRDPAAYLSVPAAIDFQHANAWEVVRADCHGLAAETRRQLVDLLGLPALAPESWFGQMFTVALPSCDVDAVKTRLYDAFRVEVPLWVWRAQPYLRVSFQGYNTSTDAHALISALTHIFPHG